MDTTRETIADWIVRQRWYSGKGSLPRLRTLAELPLPSLDPDASVRLLLFADDSDDRIPVYLVPVVERGTIPKGAGPTLIGRCDEGRYLFDGPEDPAFAPSLLAAMTGGVSELGDAPIRSTAVLRGEQSNTSVIVAREGAVDLIVKVFRVVHHGENPDAVIQSTLSEAGIPFVPRFFGQVVGEWTDGHGETGVGHLAVVQEFVTGAEDAWRVALRAEGAGESFATQAHELGRATAVMHEVLAERLPTRDATVGDQVTMVAIWHARLATAIRDLPELEASRAAIEAAYDAAQDAVWPRLQRIHGDLHLGQVLHAPDGRWTFIDFEGEPLRSLYERTQPEPSLRDVAGMLRSFEYAAAAGEAARIAAGGERSTATPDQWAAEARAAFIAGYQDAASSDPLTHRVLLDALELDKAVYEVSYEARNRPEWVGIPLRAIARLTAARRDSAHV